MRQIVAPQVAGGAFSLRLCADSRDEVVESGESNCVLSDAISPRQPDLTVIAATAPASATAGDTVTVTYTVRNGGNGGAAGFRGDLLALSDDAAIGGDRTVAAPTSVETIAAGAEVVRTASFTIPNSVEGPQRLVVTVDSTRSIDEAGETAGSGGALPNTFLLATPIEVAPAPRPNLVVTAASAPASAVEGQRLAVDFTVVNTGAGLAEGGWVDAIYATRTDGPGFVRLAAEAGPTSLAAGASYARSIGFTAPAAGTWRLTAVADDASNLLERTAAGSDAEGESDNTRVAQAALAIGGVVVTATVLEPELELPTPATLVIESRSQSTGEPVAGVAGTRLTLVDGFPTTAPFTTGADGRAVVEVAPVAGNAGVYGYGARAGGGTPPVQTQAIYWGVSLEADAAERRVAQGGAASGRVLVRNLGELAIEGAELTVLTEGDGLSATLAPSAGTLGANESRFVD